MSVFARRHLQLASEGRVIFPHLVERPDAGNAAYRVVLELRNGRGEMEPPDNAEIFLRVLSSTGTEYKGETRLYQEAALTNPLVDSTDATNFPHAAYWVEQTTSIQDGRFEAFLKVASTDTDEDHITIEFGWIEQGKVNVQSARGRVGDAADLDTIDSNVDAILVDTGTTLPASLSTMEGKIDTVDGIVDTILLDTAELQTDWTNGGRLDLLIDSILADTAELQTDWANGGRLDLILDGVLADTGTTLPASLSTIEGKIDTIDAIIDAIYVDTDTTLPTQIATVDANVDAILLDTGELQTDWTNGGRLDVILDNVLADTGELQTDWANGGRLDLLIDSILADTGELQTDWANGGRLDLLLDGIITDVGDPSGGPGAFVDLSALIGAPNDVAVDPDAGNGSLFAYVKNLEDQVAALAAANAVQRNSFTAYPYNGNGILTADPLVQEDVGAVTTQSLTVKVLDVAEIDLPGGVDADIQSIAVALVWKSQGTDGGGGGGINTVFYVSEDNETVGNAPGGNALAITDVVVGTTAKATHRRSGLVKTDALPVTGDFYLVLCGYVDDIQDTCRVWGVDETNLEIDYKRV